MPPTLTDEEIRYFFHGDTECLKRSHQQADVQNVFIRPADRDENGQVDHSILMRKRTFVNELPAIKWTCRAPIGNGKLCERMDRYKCPFHGRIVARNALGEAEDETIRRRENEEKQKRTRDDWQDPEYLEDLRLATGLERKMDANKKKKRKKNRLESNLTEIEREDESARGRLEKKIFNR